jgi:hypothetical protein
MDATQKEIAAYLAEVKASVRARKYRIELNEKRIDKSSALSF